MLCRACNRRLTDPESLALGIGPVCAARIGIVRVKAKRERKVSYRRREVASDARQVDWIGVTP